MINANRRRGRGGRTNESGRYESLNRSDFDDGWETIGEASPFETNVQIETAKTILTTNDSPDIPFNQSINPYRGCEHGCPYCFARPTHAYMGLSPGLDFESRLFVKTNAAELLRKELSKRSYRPQTIAMGTNTDPYQPIEKRYKITRSILELCRQTRHPVGIVTKSALITRDIDILQDLAKNRLASVGISVTSLDRMTARSMEPRASTPQKRLDALKKLSDAGIQTRVLMAPVIPGINDHEIESVLEAAKKSGAMAASYIILRLPLELKEIFREWLETDFPNRAGKVYSIMRTMRGGKLYDSAWGERMRGNGPFADIIEQRFKKCMKRLGFVTETDTLRTDLFVSPTAQTDQLELF